MTKITYRDFSSKKVSSGKFANLKRNSYRFRKARKDKARKFVQIDFPRLLKECEILTESRTYHYCFIMQEWTKNPLGGVKK
jgi:hypothetical protein